MDQSTIAAAATSMGDTKDSVMENAVDAAKGMAVAHGVPAAMVESVADMVMGTTEAPAAEMHDAAEVAEEAAPATDAPAM